MSFKLKKIVGRSVLYVMAVDAEYGSCLRSRLQPLFTGVGPVEAAIGLTNALSHLAIHKNLPDLIVSLGSAGSRTLVQTKVYQASSVSYRDMDASALGFEKGKTPFLDQPAEIELSLQLPDLPAVRLSTGASIISGDDYDTINADMVDMETFALKRVCQHFARPLIALRGISDGVDDLNQLVDWTKYLHIIDEKLATAVDELEMLIHDHHLDF